MDAEESRLTKEQVARFVRARLTASIHDDSRCAPQAFAVYTLSDPRSIRDVRYVGQTRLPVRRLGQHINTAQLWLPDEAPWWFKSPELRPLYEWIRQLHKDEHRLPCMVIVEWLPTLAQARAREREHIYEHLRARRPLFNVERVRLAHAVPLL